MRILSDIHGRLEYLENELSQIGDETLYQLGDFGFGFVNVPNSYPSNLKIIRGNHDNPELFSQHPNALDDFGFIEEDNLFYIGGAYSIDKHRRIEGRSWWSNEELTFSQTYHCLELYEKVRHNVKIIISHAAPQSLLRKWWGWDGNSHTEALLQNILEIQFPQYWYFGHYHRFSTEKINGCRFTCIDQYTALTHKE